MLTQFHLASATSNSKVLLLQQNKKRREPGETVTLRTMMPSEAKSFKLNANHVPLRQIVADIRLEGVREEEVLDENKEAEEKIFFFSV